MRWYPRSSGKRGTVLPSKTFRVGTDLGLRGGRQSHPGLPTPSSPGPCCPPALLERSFWESLTPCCPSSTQTQSMGSSGILSAPPPEPREGHRLPSVTQPGRTWETGTHARLTEKRCFYSFLSSLWGWQLEGLRVDPRQPSARSPLPFQPGSRAAWNPVGPTPSLVTSVTWLTHSTSEPPSPRLRSLPHELAVRIPRITHTFKSAQWAVLQ